MNKLSLLIIDDHTLFRSGIIALLRRYEEFVLLGETGDPMAGVKLAKSLDPDVILLDLHMPGISGVEVLKILVAEKIRAQVLMLTVSEDGEDLIDALCAGARGYLLKNIDTEALVAAIRQAAHGETVVCPEMSSKLVEGVRNPGRKAAKGEDENPLSPREREILSHIARGDSNKEIAQLLNLADSTVKIHVQNIFKKLNITSRVQAAVYAIDHGFR
ncbi:response regulator transcription factor [uncultured Azonexus sp.]|uniref:response regulator n=1 Tax=uncultured Azonexus sp. TaxID=520307 RepID=UPI00260FD569|nr:response regulator transcription factor [uncultured Azonexus sp.]